MFQIIYSLSIVSISQEITETILSYVNRDGPIVAFDPIHKSSDAKRCHFGGFQLEFVSISWIINHMTSYKF